MSNASPSSEPPLGKNSRRGPIILVAGSMAALALLAGFIWSVSRGSERTYTTFTVRRGPLDIKVLEGGNVEALESQEVKSQVKGWQGVKILSIVEEGYYVTKEDIANKLKLVELDSSELQDKLTTSEITFRGTQASLSEAEQGFEIQINKSESDIYASELELKFAKLEMEKYLGARVAQIVLDKIAAHEEEMDAIESAKRKKEEDEAAAEETATLADAVDMLKADLTGGEGGLGTGPSAPPVQPRSVPAVEPLEEYQEMTLDDLRLSHPSIDFKSFADATLLGDGEANQQLRKNSNDLLVAESEWTTSKTERDGKKRLFEREFVTKNELESAEMIVEKNEIKVKTAESAQHNFIAYDFPKEAEKRVSDYIQGMRKLERTERSALSELAKARSKLLSAQARYRIEQERIREYREQIEKCSMYAERVGLVVYGGSGTRYWDAEPIKEGATIRQRQAIITIPDMSTMAVKVKIHESDIKKIKVGQSARVRVDAFPDELLTGEVTKVAVLPDSENRWMNPDLKVYETTVKIAGTHEWLKPGMSAETEILIERLDEAIYIPIQSVVPVGNKQVCFVVNGSEVEPREIVTGELTVEFITVLEGLSPGEEVLIRPPEGSRRDEGTDDEADAPESEETSDAKEPETEVDKAGASGAEAEVETPKESTGTAAEDGA